MTLANIGKKDYRGIIPARVDIDERPAIVDEKTCLGDWKADMAVSALEQSPRKSLNYKTPREVFNDLTGAIL